MPIKIKMAKPPHKCVVFWDSTLFLKRCWRCLLALLNKSFGSRHFFKTCFLSCVSPFSNTDLLEDPQQTTTTNTNQKKKNTKKHQDPSTHINKKPPFLILISLLIGNHHFPSLFPLPSPTKPFSSSPKTPPNPKNTKSLQQKHPKCKKHHKFRNYFSILRPHFPPPTSLPPGTPTFKAPLPTGPHPQAHHQPKKKTKKTLAPRPINQYQQGASQQDLMTITNQAPKDRPNKKNKKKSSSHTSNLK